MGQSLSRHDRRLLMENPILCGVDEAGRGALAGPVVAGAVLLVDEFYKLPWCRRHGGRIQDSKKIPAEAREELRKELDVLCGKGVINAATGQASVGEIEEHNILGATKLAMLRALRELEKLTGMMFARETGGDLLFGQEATSPRGPLVLVDGKPLRDFPIVHRALVGGDGRSLAIAMASIFAKTERDRLMRELDGECPGYGFATHKGYGTAEHREALLKLGPSPHHRPLFLRKILCLTEMKNQGDLVFGGDEDLST